MFVNNYYSLPQFFAQNILILERKLQNYNIFFMSDTSEIKQPRALYFTEKIKNFAYNTKYKALRYFEEYDKLSIIKPGDEIFLLGSKFKADQENIKQINEQIYRIFHNTPWLTYRSGFPQLKNQIQGSYVSDTGWGCMVRVGQMLFAEVIKHHQNIETKDGILKILQLFNDFDKAQPFSIQNISKVARVQYGLKPGEWYNPSQIAFVLNRLHQKYLAEEMNLKFCIFNSGNLFFDSVIEKMIGGKDKCSCKKKQGSEFLCSKCNKVKNSIATIVLTRIGLSTPEIKYLDILDKFMEFPEFKGILGGKPEKALYFVGRHEKHYIYLDPHYVQNAEKQTSAQQETYFCASFRKCRNTAIDSSMGLCFYMRDIAELNSFYKNINKLKNDCIQDFFIFVADETPVYIKDSTRIQMQYCKDQDDFQEL